MTSVRVVGQMLRRSAPLPRGAPLRRPQLIGLEEWSDSLAARWLVAVLAAEDEQDKGVDWLAFLTGPAFVVPDDLVYNGQQYRAVTALAGLWRRASGMCCGSGVSGAMSCSRRRNGSL